MKLGFGQRLVIVLGLGAALVAVGDYITSLGIPSGWYSYTPLSRPPLLAGLSAGPRLAVWLILTALWVAVSLFLLREPPVAAPGGTAAPGPATDPTRPGG